MARLGARQVIRGFDLGLLTVTVLLVIFGLAALYSFSLNVSQPDYSLLIRQTVFAAVGLVAAILLIRVDYRWLAGVHWLLYGLGLALLLAVLFFGATVNGTRGWFELGIFQFQPVELMKIILAVVLAKFLADQASTASSWRLLLTTGIVTLVPVALVMRQPDLGSAVILLGMWLILLIVSPIPRKYFIVLMLALTVIGTATWFVGLRPYQKERILNVVQPSRDPLGTGYNVRQAITAIGAGGWFGRGLGSGTQSQLNFVPERQTDFIFASIAEELGLFGSLILVLLFGLFFWRLARLMSGVHDAYGAYLTMALAAMFFLQAAINLLMNIGLFPVTGLPLPFLSYGGSSLIVSLMAVGILESIVVRQRTAPL